MDPDNRANPYFVPDAEMIVWDQDGTMYRRVGGCTTKNCGKCCEFVVVPLDQRLRQAPRSRFNDWKKWLELHGGMSVYESGDWLALRIPIKCDKLTEEGQCAVFGTEERPELCSRFPRQPLDLEELEGICTYGFEKVTTDDL